MIRAVKHPSAFGLVEIIHRCFATSVKLPQQNHGAIRVTRNPAPRRQIGNSGGRWKARKYRIWKRIYGGY